jgi:hypothetical protein
MKTKLTAFVITAATALTLTPKSAFAGDKEWAAVGGFLGGLVVGSVIHDARPHRTTTVIVADRGGHHDGRPAGYWKDVSVRTWVPAHWETRYDYGRCVRVYVPGHYAYRTEHVWVSHGRHHGHHHDRGDHCEREVGYGYGYRR